MQDCKPSETPTENNMKLEVAQEDSERVDSHEFRILVGSLLYLANKLDLSCGSQMSYHAS